MGADRDDIVDTVNRYGAACDRRDWALFDDVFTPDASADYGLGALHGRDAIVASIRSFLGGCGPSQHLLGNHEVTVDGDAASARCVVRACHLGAEPRSTRVYEVLGEYEDRLVRTAVGWRITFRGMRVSMQLGDASVLGPG